MVKKITAMIFAAVLISGCSKIFTPSKSDPNPQTKEDTAQMPQTSQARQTANQTVASPDTQTLSGKEYARQTRPAPEITFTSAETEHIRIAHYNPFAGSAIIEIDLEAEARNFCYPYNGKPISRYGMRGRSMHTGLDIKAIPNDTIRSILAGVVRMSKVYSGYGNVVVIRHSNGLESIYGHNSRNLVSPNDIVEAGTPIALAGRTGTATTEHLHFELRVMGEHFNPELMLDAENRTLKAGELLLTNNKGKVYASNSLLAAPTKATADISSANSRKAINTANSIETHTIRKGDTLSKIARQYGTSVKSLCMINNIAENNILRIGQKIKVR